MSNKYIFKKGELNSLNKLNQDLKTIYKTYVLVGTGTFNCIGEPVINKGKHICKTSYIFPNIDMNQYLVSVNSTKVFQAIKDNKKSIIGYDVIDGDIYFISEGDNKWQIGSLSPCYEFVYNKYAPQFFESVSLYTPSIYNVKLSEDDVIKLTQNEYLNISCDKFRTRITREVIPGLKKSNTVSIHFSEIPDSPNLFRLIIDVARASVKSIHMYTCLYI